jgi:hypothetical protein
MNWEYCSVYLERTCEEREWQAVVQPDGATGRLSGWKLILDHYGTYGWELTALMPLAYRVSRNQQGFFVTIAVASFKRSFDLRRVWAEVVSEPLAGVRR